MILIDPPAWPAHGRLWSHLASDTSLAELHDFATRAGLSRRAFEGDHYDVPAERHDSLVAAGAVPTSARVLLAAIVAAGLRRPRRRGEEVIRSRQVGDYYPGAGPCRVDVIVSGLAVPAQASRPGWWIDVRGGLIRAEEGPAGWRLPPLSAADGDGQPVGYVRVRLLGSPGPDYRGPMPWVFHPARRPARTMPGSWIELRDLADTMAHHDVWPLIARLHG